MKVFPFVALIMLVSFALRAQDKPAYRIYNKAGKEVSYEKMLKSLGKSEIVLFGELHNNPVCHWLQLQVTKDLYATNANLTLGFEMFESDDQLVLNEYLQGLTDERHLLKEAKVWDNYKTDYKPLIEFARENKLRAIATNVPRRYANLVYRKGIESLQALPEEAQQFIAPLPITIDLELPGYKNMISTMGGHAAAGSAENMARSQAVKDATMAHFILQNHTGGIFIHYHGTYHSANFEGILWYLQRAKPSLAVSTIHSVEQASIDKLSDEHKGTADFIICIPADMTKTY